MAHYVAPSGTDSGTCIVAASPCRTIAVACGAPNELAVGAAVTFTVHTGFLSVPACGSSLVNNVVATADGEVNTANNND